MIMALFKDIDCKGLRCDPIHISVGKRLTVHGGIILDQAHFSTACSDITIAVGLRAYWAYDQYKDI